MADCSSYYCVFNNGRDRPGRCLLGRTEGNGARCAMYQDGRGEQRTCGHCRGYDGQRGFCRVYGHSRHPADPACREYRS